MDGKKGSKIALSAACTYVMQQNFAIVVITFKLSFIFLWKILFLFHDTVVVKNIGKVSSFAFEIFS